MDLSIIIVNYRGWEKLRECLDYLATYRNIKFTTEIIVVDNNSNDGIFETFSRHYPRFRFIRNDTNGGFSYGCNRGAGESAGKFLLFLNPDTLAPEDSVTALLERAMTNPGDNILSCRQNDEKGKESAAYGRFIAPGKLTGPGRAINRFKGKIMPSQRKNEALNPKRPDWVSGSVIMISRDFYKKLGGFDEDFWMYFEDMDLCRRARYKGGEVLYFTNFSIQHNHGGSSRVNIYTTALTKTEVLISRHLYVSKHFSPGQRFFSHIFLIFNNLITGLISAIAGIILFFEPRIYVYTHIFFRLAGYYAGALTRGSWISPRSVRWQNRTN